MSGSAVEFKTLGPIELTIDGEAVVVRRGKFQSLLALLLVKANSMAERDWLIDQLWSGHPPATAIPTLRSHLYHLRKHLTRCASAAVGDREPDVLGPVRSTRLSTLRSQNRVRSPRRTAPVDRYCSRSAIAFT